jgi:predicted transcriptional regulator of viral defense system
MDARLATLPAIPFEYDVLKHLYHDYASPKDKIARLVNEGQLVRLKKGLYARAPQVATKPVERGLVANRMIAPSYVSLETALYLYQMIPERAVETRSVTIKRSRLIENVLGRFRYFQVRRDYLSLGITNLGVGEGTFLIASPAKALCDLVALTRNLRIQSVGAMRAFIEDDMRIDLEPVGKLDSTVFETVAQTDIKRREILLLKEYCHGIDATL